MKTQVQKILEAVRSEPGGSACFYTHIVKPNANRYAPASILRELQRLVDRGLLRRIKGVGVRGLAWKFYPCQCHAARDGECIYKRCPQIRDGEPDKTGRHCPLDYSTDMDIDDWTPLPALPADTEASRLFPQ